MSEFLIGIEYHDPKTYAMWCGGLTEDYESSAGLFVEAESPDAAVAWGGHIGQALLAFVHEGTAPAGPPATSWLESTPESSGWRHCLDFFQHVRVGEMPDLAGMTAEAYQDWLVGHGKTPSPARSPDSPGRESTSLFSKRPTR